MTLTTGRPRVVLDSSNVLLVVSRQKERETDVIDSVVVLAAGSLVTVSLWWLMNHCREIG